MQCGSCNKSLQRGKGDSSKDAVTTGCANCSTKYHAICLNLSREEMRQLRTTGSVASCPSCKARKKNLISDSTPIRAVSQNTAPVDDEKLQSPESSGKEKSAFNSCTRALNEMQAAFLQMKQEMCDFTSSLNSTSEDIFEFRREINDLKAQVKELDHYKAEASLLRQEVFELRQELAAQQQRSYLKDIEICGLTEHKDENLFHTVSVLTAKLGVEIDQSDIDDVRRVGTQTAAGPRPVVVTLVRRAPRNKLLRAARVRRGITTDQIEVAGNSRKIFVNEHLTKQTRVLFSKARSVGKAQNFKYVWTSNGNIFMRRSETSSVLRVSSEAILDKLVGDPATAPLNSRQFS